jgi:hypothetical protein
MTSWLAASPSGAMAAEARTITIAGSGIYPESVTSTQAGDVIFGSMGKGGVYRAKPGETVATLWIDPAKMNLVSVLGVLADEPSNTLYVCSSGDGAPPDRADVLSAVRTFDLKTGAPKGSYPMPGGRGALCNDFAIGKDGTVYVAETLVGQVLRLKKGARALEVFVKDDRLAGADGVALGGDGALYINSFTHNRFVRVAVNADGSAGAVTPLTTSIPLDHPDGLRSLGAMRFLQAEGGGRIDLVTVSGDKALITPLKTGEPGLVGMTVTRGKVWAVDGKLAYRNDPALKGQDPGPFEAEALPLPK